MIVPTNFGGGSGGGSDECTASASDVLAGKTAVYNGSNDEPASGTMTDYSGTTTATSATTNNSSSSRVELTVPNTGKYDTSAKLYSSYSNVASAVSLTAAKIATGNTIMGISGTYTGLGSATQDQVLSGKTFSTASLSNASGTMTDKSGTSTSATMSTSGSNVRLQIPANGYYNTSAYLTTSYSNMASVIGLTAAKIKSGESILGITGTWSGYVATSTDLYYYGSVGSLGGSINTYGPSSSGAAALDTSCVNIQSSNSATNQWGIMFSKTLACGSYSKITITFTCCYEGSSNSNSYVYVGVFSSLPSSSSMTQASSSITYASKDFSSISTFTTYTVSVDISSVSQSAYVGVGLRNYSSILFYVDLLRVQVS